VVRHTLAQEELLERKREAIIGFVVVVFVASY
jgi:hypothetical protein